MKNKMKEYEFNSIKVVITKLVVETQDIMQTLCFLMTVLYEMLKKYTEITEEEYKEIIDTIYEIAIKNYEIEDERKIGN